MPTENNGQSGSTQSAGTDKPSASNQATAYPSVNTSTSQNVASLGTRKSAEFERIVKSYTEEKSQ
jgi:hypothetical protein